MVDIIDLAEERLLRSEASKMQQAVVIVSAGGAEAVELYFRTHQRSQGLLVKWLTEDMEAGRITSFTLGERLEELYAAAYTAEPEVPEGNQ